VAKTVLDKYFNDAEGNKKPWLFPQLVNITRRWMSSCVTIKDNAFIQMLMMTERSHLLPNVFIIHWLAARPGRLN